MKARFVQVGDYIDYTPDTDIEAGDVVIVGGLKGVANHPIAAGETGAIATVGVFAFAKAGGDSGAAIDIGDSVYWDAANNVATETSTGNTPLGVAVAAAAESDDIVRVKIG